MRDKELARRKNWGVASSSNHRQVFIRAAVIIATSTLLALMACAPPDALKDSRNTNATTNTVEPIIGDWVGYMAINDDGETAPVNNSNLAASFLSDHTCSIRVFDSEFSGEWSVSNTAKTFVEKRMKNEYDVIGYYEINMDDKSVSSATGVLWRGDDGNLYLMPYFWDQDTAYVLTRKE